MSVLPVAPLARVATRERRPLSGLAVILVLAAPTLALEEDWHGRPMIDQGGHLWVIPTLVVAAVFALGGALAGWRSGTIRSALLRSTTVGASSAALFLVADVLRRTLRHQQFSVGVGRLWVEAALLSVIIAAIGGIAAHVLRPHGP